MATLLAAASAGAQTFAHWNFNQGTPGEPFSPGEDGGATPDVPDQSGNDFWLSGWNEDAGPSFSQAGGGVFGTGLSMRAVGQDAFTGHENNNALNNWSPTSWTIELAVRLDNVASPNQTLVGRDESSFEGEPKANFYLQTFGTGSTYRLDFATVTGERIIIDSADGGIVPQDNRWTGLAATSDGTTVSFYVTDNNFDYQLVGSQDFDVADSPDNALATTGAVWTVGRGWWDGGLADWMTGNVDNVRFTEGALDPGDFIAVPEPSTYAMLFGALVLAGTVWIRRRRKS